jgi:ubiquinone/menaquinone biosynthesis C-methylase UbiE
MNEHIAATKDWYDDNYRAQGLRAQRRYPNEELVRFISRRYLSLAPDRRAQTDVLEVGSGLCGNLWMVAREGLRAHGLDISAEAIKLGGETLKAWGVSAMLTQGSMLEMPYADAAFDAVYDVLASFSLTSAEFPVYLREVRRVLKPAGRFFLFTLSSESDAFKTFAPAVKLDDWTLNGIHRKDSPYYGCFYPHRFDDPRRLAETLKAHGFEIASLETVDRTYNGGAEKLQCVSVESQKS